MSSYRNYIIDIVRTNIDGEPARVTSPSELAEMFRGFAGTQTRESLFVIAFNGQNGVIGIDKLYEGTATGTSVRINEIFHPLVHLNAVGFALAHNHPSLDVTASDADLALTKEVLKAAHVFDLTMLDHIILGENNHFSIRSATQFDESFQWEKPEHGE